LPKLVDVVSDPDQFYEELVLHDPAKPGKPRPVVNVLGTMRDFQTRLYRKTLIRKLSPSFFSHGGVPGRSLKTNVEPHLGSSFVLVADISNFYPSIHYPRVYRLFVERFGCSPDVGRLCTRLCTYRDHLALGLITSPILADQILRRVDLRIAAVCREAKLVYTRFVDDITISGQYDLKNSGIPRVVEEILGQDGFKINPNKNKFGRLSAGLTITGLRTIRGRLDVSRDFLNELDRQLDDAASLAQGGAFTGPYYLENQILGRIHFACWINRNRRSTLLKKHHSINWSAVDREARRRRYVVCQKRLCRPGIASGHQVSAS
jgi:hypothetical protein